MKQIQNFKHGRKPKVYIIHEIINGQGIMGFTEFAITAFMTRFSQLFGKIWKQESTCQDSNSVIWKTLFPKLEDVFFGKSL